jgi:hypothetical protein
VVDLHSLRTGGPRKTHVNGLASADEEKRAFCSNNAAI